MIDLLMILNIYNRGKKANSIPINKYIQEIVQFLLKTKGLSKMSIGEILGNESEFYIRILDEFVDALNFTNMDLGLFYVIPTRNHAYIPRD